MIKNINQINRISLDGNENIIIQDVENTTITINKNDNEKLKSFFETLGDKILDLEDIISGNKKEFLELKSLIKEQYYNIKKTVMVVGTGDYDLPEEVYQASIWVGKILAELEYNIVVGGWQGVDYVVADEFSKIINKTEYRLSEKLTQVVTNNKSPVFKGGEVNYVKQGVMEWVEGLKNAKALIVIGGKGGTYETFNYAKQEKVIVIPIAHSGGDARKIFNEITSNINSFEFANKHKELFSNMNKQNFHLSLKKLLIKLFS